MTLSRRSLITGLVSFVAAPTIVRASSLMPVKAWVEPSIDFMGTHSIDPTYRAEFIRAFEQHYDRLSMKLVRETVVHGHDVIFEIARQS